MKFRRSMLWVVLVLGGLLALPAMLWPTTPVAAHDRDGHHDAFGRGDDDRGNDRGRGRGHGHHHDGDDDGDHHADCSATRCAAQAAIAERCPCDEATSRGRYIFCVARATKELGISRKCRGEIIRCAARSTCGQGGAVTCTRHGKCGIASSAEKCERRGGTVGTGTSCCGDCPTQCCVPTSVAGAFDDSPIGAFTCEVLTPDQCAAQNGIDRGPGTCEPDPCAVSTTTVPTTTSTSTSLATTSSTVATTSTTEPTTSSTVATTTSTVASTTTTIPTTTSTAPTTTVTSSTTTTTLGSPSGAFL